MAQQSSNGNRPKLSEKGLLTPDNCVVALIDHQGQMLFGTSNFDRQGIINNTVAFGKAARVFDAAERVVLTPRTETVGVQHHRLDLSGLSVCAVSSRKKPTGKWFRNQAEAAIPQSYPLSRRVQ